MAEQVGSYPEVMIVNTDDVEQYARRDVWLSWVMQNAKSLEALLSTKSASALVEGTLDDVYTNWTNVVVDMQQATGFPVRWLSLRAMADGVRDPSTGERMRDWWEHLISPESARGAYLRWFQLRLLGVPAATGVPVPAPAPAERYLVCVIVMLAMLEWLLPFACVGNSGVTEESLVSVLRCLKFVGDLGNAVEKELDVYVCTRCNGP